MYNYTGGNGKSSNRLKPAQSSESKSGWIARKCKPPQAFLAASQASASLDVWGVFLKVENMYRVEIPTERIRRARAASASTAQTSNPLKPAVAINGESFQNLENKFIG